MNEMLGLQWAMISLLALSGVAGSPELLREPDRPAGGASQTQTQYLPDDSKHVQQERLPRSPSRHTTAQDFPTLTQRPVSQPQRPVLSPVRVSRYPSPEKQGALRSPTLEGPTLSKSPMSPGRFEESMPPWEFNPAHQIIIAVCAISGNKLFVPRGETLERSRCYLSIHVDMDTSEYCSNNSCVRAWIYQYLIRQPHRMAIT